MFANLLARSPDEVRSFSAGSRAGRILLALLCAVGLAVGFAYHLVLWSTGTPPSFTGELVYNLVVLAAYTSLWMLLSSVLTQRHPTPAKAFWTTLLIGVLVLAVGHLVLTVAAPPAELDVPVINRGGDVPGFDPNSGKVPLAAAIVFLTNLLPLIEVTFAFFLLLRFRSLVLFKRTKTSQRNWHLMLAFMVMTSLLTLMRPADQDDFSVPAIVAMFPTVALMVVNAFRLSWIVFLSFREKMACIGLSVLLLALLAAGFQGGEGGGLLPNALGYLRHYNYPLSVFTTLSFVFGILYCTTAFLSLLFHLPTTGDFQQKVGEMAAMHSLTTLIGQVFDPDQLVSTIAASPVEAGSAHAAWLAVADPQRGSLRPEVVATYRVTPEEVRARVDVPPLYEEVHHRREPLLIEQAPADHRLSVQPGDGLGSLLVVPLIARDELLGALFVTKEVTHGFEKDDIEAISVFAAQAALALDNARLFEEQLEKERLARELSIAREVQRKLLPQCLPHLEGGSICASSVPAQEVGGDYYDFQRLDEHRLALIIGDVSGKGTSAAFYMAEMQGIFRALSRIVSSPAAFLSHANEALAASLDRHAFVSAIYGVLDLQREEFVLARAGHCPAAMIHLDGQARYLRTQGLGLGLDRGPLFQNTLAEEHIRLQPGDVFVLYTDGIVESRNEAGEEYGYDRLLCSLRTHRHEDASDLHDALLRDLNAFLGHDAYDDDMTLLVLKWHGIQLPRPAAEAVRGKVSVAE